MGTFCVVGATSWGLTLAWLLGQGGHRVRVITRDADEASRLTLERTLARLPELRLAASIAFTSGPAIPPCDGVIVAAPAQAVRATIAGLGETSLPVLSAAKGIEHETHQRMTEVIAARWPESPVGALSGPNLSREIVAGRPAAAVVASRDDEVAELWQTALRGPRFRCYRSNDVAGVELAGALKNVIAIAAGVGWGLDLGANAVAALMTRGLAEMTRLGVALGAEPETFRGLAGIGDLSATCFSPLSRNRRFGELLARGMTVESARNEIGEAIEGMATARAAVELAAPAGVELPICSEVLAVLEGRQDVAGAISALMGRTPREE
jgi:glycerol-3-phosphate dehydrogenase (NAD(P)+)